MEKAAIFIQNLFLGAVALLFAVAACWLLGSWLVAVVGRAIGGAW